jgi:diguanylate cyclase (GGDEF)-like protein/PAS domain S-box-containing protein
VHEGRAGQSGHVPTGWFVRWMPVSVLAVAGLAWMGWATGVEVLTRLVPGWPPMTPWTALWLAALAVAVLLQADPKASSIAVRSAQVISIVVGTVAALVLLQYLTDSTFGLDTWWFGTAVSTLQSTYPGRPSPQTATTAVALAAVAGLVRTDGAGSRLLWAIGLTVGIAIPAFAIGGYLFNAGALVSVAVSTGMALLTALGLLALAGACVLLRPDRPPLSVLARLRDPVPVARAILVIAGLPLTVAVVRDIAIASGAEPNTALVIGLAVATILTAAVVYASSASEQRASAERLRLAKDLAEANASYRLLADNSADVVLRVRAGTIVWMSASVTDVLGGAPDEWLGVDVTDVIHPDDMPAYLESLADVDEGGSVVRRVRVRAHDGAYRWIEAHAKTFLDAEANPDGFVSSLRVVDTEVAAQRELEHLARFDTLTGVLNRAEALSRLEAATAQPRSPGRESGVLFCDVDRFKQINDTHGHAAGDEVLRILSRRITACIRREDIVARMGGDEFLVYLTRIHDVDEATMIAEKIRAAVAVPIPLGDGRGTVQATLSIGVALATPGEPADAIIARADAAMYMAKDDGRNTVTLIRS